MSNKFEADDQPSSISNQQFGVTIYYIKNLNVNMVDGIPPVVRQCVEYLSTPEVLETVDIFRLSANPSVIREMQRMCNSGEEIIFDNNPHDAAALLKTFLRELEEPILTFELYEQILHWKSRSPAISAKTVKSIILEKLPVDNYVILKYLIKYLWKVKERSNINNMDAVNLAVVFGPTLVWPFIGTRTLHDIVHINAFLVYLLEHQEDIFIK